MSSSYTEDRIALQDVMLRYAAGVDDRNYEQYAGCFWDNVEVFNFGTQTYQCKEDWLSYVWSALEKYSSSQHMLGPQLASINGDRAHTRNDVQALHYFKGGEHERFLLWATYLTDMQRIDGEWRIIRHELVTRGTELLPR